MVRILGLEPRQGAGSDGDLETFVHPDDWPQFHASVRAALDGTPYGQEIRILRPDGSTRHVFAMGEAELGPDGKVKGLFGTMQDITERKQVEKTLREQSRQVRILSARLSEAEESERKRIARELHDQVGQNLTVVGINLSIVKSKLPAEGMDMLHARLEDSMVLVEEITEFTRGLMSDLRPPDMDLLGLVAAIGWYGERFSMRTGADRPCRGRGDPPAARTGCREQRVPHRPGGARTTSPSMPGPAG